jgi:hypothetical protein
MARTNPAADGETRFEVEVPGGTTTAVWTAGAGATGNLAIHAHGAGSHLGHRLVVAQATAIGAAGFDVVRFDFPYRAAGRGRPDRMPVLMEAYRAVADAVRERFGPARLVIGGQSMGGRTASLLAAEGFACDGLLLLAYPLHPPGRPGKARDEHLPRIGVPTLCLNGTRDKLCERELMERVLERTRPAFRMHWIEGADHGFRVPARSGRKEADVMDEVRDAVRTWASDALAD